jgi:hypothetical protein
MKKLKQIADFEPERVETLSEWRLLNSALPVNENAFRERLRKGARKANKAFDDLIAHGDEWSEDIVPTDIAPPG